MVLSKKVETAFRLPAKRQINRQGELVFEILVSPAPRRLKPLAEIPNPYPYGCSVLCRHPRDPELRHVIWHSQKSPKEHAVGSRATNEAFQRWPTKRLASPAGSALSLRSIPCSKRSRTPDFHRKVLTFDLRPWRSFDCLSSTTLGRTLDENEIKQEDFELLSPQDAVPPTRSRAFRNKQEFNSARPRIQQNETPESLFYNSVETLIGKGEAMADRFSQNLLISGVRTIALIKKKTISKTNHSTNKSTAANNLDKPKKLVAKDPTEDLQVKEPKNQIKDQEDQDSVSSSEEQGPFIWVEIHKKPGEVPVPADLEIPQTDPASEIAENPLLPEDFKKFLRKSYSFIAQVEEAKRRSYSNQIIHVPEENIQWTSNAPKLFPAQPDDPAESKTKSKTKRKNLKLESFSPEVLGVQMKGKTKPKIKKKTVQEQKKLRTKDIRKDPELDFERKVTFQLPDEHQDPRKILKNPKTIAKAKNRKKFKVKKSAPRRSAAKQATKNPARSSSNQTGEILERQMLLDGKCETVDLKQDSNEEAAAKEEDQDPDPTPRSSESEPLVNDTEDPVHEEISEIIPESVPEKQQSQSQLKGIPSLEEIMKTLQIDSTVTQFAVPSPGENPERNWVRFSRNENFFSNLPRAGKYFGARFELPMDLRLLQDLSPLEYLRCFTVSSRCRKRLNESVFLQYSRNEAIDFQDLWIALSEILGFPISQQFQDQFQDLVKISGSENFSLDEFHGLSAAAERLGCREVSLREELEKADFRILFNKYLDTSISESLKDLLVFINNS